MGYDAYAVAVLGVRHDPGVIRSKLFRERTVRACSHEMDESKKFCPECGAPTFKTVKEPIEGYEDGEGDGDKLHGYELVNRGEGYYDDPEFIAYWVSGLIRARDTRTRFLGDFDQEEVWSNMQAVLEPLGLWDPQAFGLHVFLYESC